LIVHLWLLVWVLFCQQWFTSFGDAGSADVLSRPSKNLLSVRPVHILRPFLSSMLKTIDTAQRANFLSQLDFLSEHIVS
jgi:hypothetical protein